MDSQNFRLRNLIHLSFTSSSFGKKYLRKIFSIIWVTVYIYKPSSIKQYHTISLHTLYFQTYIFDNKI